MMSYRVAHTAEVSNVSRNETWRLQRIFCRTWSAKPPWESCSVDKVSAKVFTWHHLYMAFPRVAEWLLVSQFLMVSPQMSHVTVWVCHVHLFGHVLHLYQVYAQLSKRHLLLKILQTRTYCLTFSFNLESNWDINHHTYMEKENSGYSVEKLVCTALSRKPWVITLWLWEVRPPMLCNHSGKQRGCPRLTCTFHLRKAICLNYKFQRDPGRPTLVAFHCLVGFNLAGLCLAWGPWKCGDKWTKYVYVELYK